MKTIVIKLNTLNDEALFDSLKEAVAVCGVPLVAVAPQHQAVLDRLRARRRRVEEDGLAPLKCNMIDTVLRCLKAGF